MKRGKGKIMSISKTENDMISQSTYSLPIATVMFDVSRISSLLSWRTNIFFMRHPQKALIGNSNLHSQISKDLPEENEDLPVDTKQM